jgi:hypothetical protein
VPPACIASNPFSTRFNSAARNDSGFAASTSPLVSASTAMTSPRRCASFATKFATSLSSAPRSTASDRRPSERAKHRKFSTRRSRRSISPRIKRTPRSNSRGRRVVAGARGVVEMVERELDRMQRVAYVVRDAGRQSTQSRQLFAADAAPSRSRADFASRCAIALNAAWRRATSCLPRDVDRDVELAFGKAAQRDVEVTDRSGEATRQAGGQDGSHREHAV